MTTYQDIRRDIEIAAQTSMLRNQAFGFSHAAWLMNDDPGLMRVHDLYLKMAALVAAGQLYTEQVAGDVVYAMSSVFSNDIAIPNVTTFQELFDKIQEARDGIRQG